MQIRSILASVLLLGLTAAALAEPTSVTVHVIASDSKFIGTSIGGARVTIEDAQTGEVLAQGITEGSTGDTELIMRQPRERDASLITPDAAGFTATLQVAEPRRVRISAYGPLDFPDSANTVAATQWLLPGEAVDGLILELLGLVVAIDDEPRLVRLQDGEAEVPVRATVMMMCGCPLTPDGIWDSNDFEVRAEFVRNGRVVATAPLGYAGEASTFEGSASLTEVGGYQLRVVASQQGTGNAGLARAAVVVDR
ncbi:MAG: hypothetical protein ACNA7W_18035 [Pseudomonadales bacterium]